MERAPTTHARPVRRRLHRLLAGAHPCLPRPLDAAAERWARLRPRARTLVVLLVAAACAAGVSARITEADARWGGRPVQVLVADRPMGIGELPSAVSSVALPPRAVPTGALRELEPDRPLSLAVPAGAVLTRAHLDVAGPAAGLAEGLRAVPVPVEDGWGVVSGGTVDVWVLGAGQDPAELVARGRPVLEVSGEGRQPTALLGLHEDEVGPTTRGLATGRVLLTHAPPSGADVDDRG